MTPGAVKLRESSGTAGGFPVGLIQTPLPPAPGQKTLAKVLVTVTLSDVQRCRVNPFETIETKNCEDEIANAGQAK
jgi:hypothetical protein